MSLQSDSVAQGYICHINNNNLVLLSQMFYDYSISYNHLQNDLLVFTLFVLFQDDLPKAGQAPRPGGGAGGPPPVRT